MGMDSSRKPDGLRCEYGELGHITETWGIWEQVVRRLGQSR